MDQPFMDQMEIRCSGDASVEGDTSIPHAPMSWCSDTLRTPFNPMEEAENPELTKILTLMEIKWPFVGIPCWSSGLDFVLLLQRAWVPCQVRNLIPTSIKLAKKKCPFIVRIKV